MATSLFIHVNIDFASSAEMYMLFAKHGLEYIAVLILSVVAFCYC